MAEKRVSVRLAAVGGRQVRAELEGVGDAGARGFGRLSREMEAANTRLAGVFRRTEEHTHQHHRTQCRGRQQMQRDGAVEVDGAEAGDGVSVTRFGAEEHQ